MKIIRWIPALLWAAFVAFLCLVPRIGIYPPHWAEKLHPDKWVHFTMFFLLTCFIVMGMGTPFWKNHRLWVILILTGIALYGGLLELAQGWFTVTRTPEFFDFLADALGTFFGWLFMLKLRKPASSS